MFYLLFINNLYVLLKKLTDFFFSLIMRTILNIKHLQSTLSIERLYVKSSSTFDSSVVIIPHFIILCCLLYHHKSRKKYSALIALSTQSSVLKVIIPILAHDIILFHIQIHTYKYISKYTCSSLVCMLLPVYIFSELTTWFQTTSLYACPWKLFIKSYLYSSKQHFICMYVLTQSLHE